MSDPPARPHSDRWVMSLWLGFRQGPHVSNMQVSRYRPSGPCHVIRLDLDGSQSFVHKPVHKSGCAEFPKAAPSKHTAPSNDLLDANETAWDLNAVERVGFVKS